MPEWIISKANRAFLSKVKQQNLTLCFGLEFQQFWTIQYLETIFCGDCIKLKCGKKI